MFGYVRILKEELTFSQYEDYRGIYCSLCRRTGKRYGHVARLLLSYDMTFVAALRLALNDQPVVFCKGRCPYNPFAKRQCCQESAVLDTVADMSLLLCYGQLQDTVTDARGPKQWGAWLLTKWLKKARRLAGERLPELAATVEECLAAQAACESGMAVSPDAAADATARMTAAMMAALSADDRERRILERLGYCLGRWIYFMDAADDLEKDVKVNAFNPFLQSEREPDFAALRLRAEQTLCASLNECISAYDLLDIRRFDGILRNILQKGCVAGQLLVTHPERKVRETNERSV